MFLLQRFPATIPRHFPSLWTKFPFNKSPALLHGGNERILRLAMSHRVHQFEKTTTLAGQCRDCELDDTQLRQLFSGRYPADYAEEVIRVRTTLYEYSGLFNAFQDTRSLGRGVKLCFNKNISSTAIFRYPSPLHATIIRSVQLEIDQRMGQENKLDDFILHTGEDNYVVGVEEGAVGVVTDLILKHWPKDAVAAEDPVFVLEVGFSETYDELLQSVQLWLTNEPSVKVVVLVKIEERPLYRCPLKVRDYLHIEPSELPLPSNLTVRGIQLQNADDPESPLFIGDSRWVGRISAFWEVWTRGESGDIVKQTDRTIFHGPDADQQPLKLNLNDFVPSEEKFKDPDLTIDVGKLQRKLSAARYSLALNRYRRFRLAHKKKRNSIKHGHGKTGKSSEGSRDDKKA